MANPRGSLILVVKAVAVATAASAASASPVPVPVPVPLPLPAPVPVLVPLPLPLPLPGPAPVADQGAAAPSTAPAWRDRDPVLAGAQRVSGTEAGDDVIAFTFDDGPSERTTPAVLDALAKYDIPATFFIVSRSVHGKKGQARRAILQRALDEGYTIGTHTVNHPNLTTLAKTAKLREIDVSLKQLTAATDRAIGLFRPPFGALDAVSAAHVKRRGLTDVRWHIDSKDFRFVSPRKLRKRVARLIAAGGRGVFLFHDTKLSTAGAIEGILDDLEAMNCGRVDAGQAPVVPVSIHYFLRDRGKPRPVPEPVAARTERYRASLADRCAARDMPAQPHDKTVNSTAVGAGMSPLRPAIDNYIKPH